MSLDTGSPEKASKSAVAIALYATGEAGNKVIQGFDLITFDTSISRTAAVDESASISTMSAVMLRGLLQGGLSTGDVCS